MGCCSSSLVDQDLSTPTNTLVQLNNESRSIPLPEAYYYNSKPFKRIGLMWTSDNPITKSQLEQQRFTFWETAPNYGGRMEIWQALQVAFSESDIILARSILEAANVILPTGNPCEGCFDELGNDYEVPVYCIVPPMNLLYEDQDDDTSSIALSYSTLVDKNKTKKDSFQMEHVDYLVPAPDSSRNPFTVTVRLSTEKDLKIEISADKETVGSLKTRIFNSVPSTNEKLIIRMVYLGRILKENLGFICDHGDIDLESTFSKKGYVRITKECIIQALIFKVS